MSTEADAEIARLKRRLAWADREVGQALGALQEAHVTRQKLREALVGVLKLYALYDECLGRSVNGPKKPAIIAANEALALVKDNPEAGT